MLKLLLAVLSWLLAANMAFAQADTPSVVVPINELYLKISPFSVFEIEGGISFSGEYVLIKPRLGLQLEIQSLLFTVFKNYNFEIPANTLESGAPLGIKIRPGIRYYFEGIRTKKYHQRTVLRANGTPMPHKNETRVYAAVDFLYKHTQWERLGNLNVSNGGTTPAFTRRVIYTDVKKTIGFDVKFGMVASISNSNRWFIEAFAGLGFRQKKFSYKDLPVGVSEPARGRSFRLQFGVDRFPQDPDPERNAVSLPAGIKLAYRLK